VGQYLKGTMTLSKDEFGKKADSMPVTYIFNEASKRDKTGKNKKSETTPTYQESLFEHKTSWLAKMDAATEDSSKLYEELIAEAGLLSEMKVTSVHAARLQSFELDTKLSLEKATSDKAEDLLKVADTVLDRITVSDILAYFAVKNGDLRPNGGSGDGEVTKKDMEKQKTWYLEASAKKGLALCVLDRLEEAGECLLHCLQFVDQTDSKVAFFATVHAEKLGHYGRALKLIQHQLEEKPNSPDLDNRLPHIFDKLGWEHAAKMSRLSKPIRFPTNFDLF